MLSVLNIANKCMFVGFAKPELREEQPVPPPPPFWSLASSSGGVFLSPACGRASPGPRQTICLSCTLSPTPKRPSISGPSEPRGEVTHGSGKAETASSCLSVRQRPSAMVGGVNNIPLAQASLWQRALHWETRESSFSPPW